MIKQDELFYKPIHKHSDVSALIKDILKTKTVKAKRINYGEVNAVYTIQTDNGDEYVLKISPFTRGENNLLQEAWAFEKCRSIGVPVPEVIVADDSLSKFPEVYLLTKKISGTPGGEIKFTDVDFLELMHQIGHYLFLIHSISVDGFGEIEKNDNQFRGRYSTLLESLNSVFTNSKWMDVVNTNNLLTEDDLRRYQKILDDNKKLFELKVASLTHGDMGPRNLIMRGNKIVGIVDMENLLTTDPIRDFHWFGYWIEDSQRLKALQNGYDNKEIFDNNFTLKMKLFQIVYSIPALAYYQNRNELSSLRYLQQKIHEADDCLRSLT